MVVPATAIATRPDATAAVFAIVSNGDSLTAHLVPVEVRSSNGTQFTVTGIEPGTEIVEVGAHLIADGQPVKRFTSLIIEGL